MKKLSIYFILSFLVILTNCKKDEEEAGQVIDEPETCSVVTFEGLDISINGDIMMLMDPASPEFQEYVNCIMECSQNEPNSIDCLMGCLNNSGVIPYGGAFTLVMEVTNTTSSDIPITFDPGTWFIASNDDFQPMLLVLYKSYTVAAGETDYISVPVFCMDNDKSSPDEESYYTICSQLTTGCMKDITDILSTKDFASMTYEQLMEVQQIIWHCADGETVDYDYLNSLP